MRGGIGTDEEAVGADDIPVDGVGVIPGGVLEVILVDVFDAVPVDVFDPIPVDVGAKGDDSEDGSSLDRALIL